ncbi:MAG: tetratricopeptide repeat protein [Planctomycetales bacterium]
MPMRFCRVVAGILLLISCAAPCAWSAEDAQEDYRLAVGFYNKEQWKLAAESFQAFLKKNGQHPKVENARYYLGLSLVKLDDFRGGRDVLRAYVKDYVKSFLPAAHYWIGHCSYHLEDFAAAEKELTTFVTQVRDDPLREWALPYLADAELRLNRPDAALVHFRAAIQSFPQGALLEETQFGMARAHELLKQPDEALRIYQRLAADKTGSRAAEAQLNLGALHFDAGRYAEAAAAYGALEQQFPQSPQAPLAQLNRGFALYRLGQYPQAIAQFDRAAQSDKLAAEAALWKGLSLRSLPDLTKAVEVLSAATKKFADLPIAEKLQYHWADCEQRRGNYDQAGELFLQGVGRWPKGSMADESLHGACQALVNGGRTEQATALLSRFEREFPGNKLRFRQEILKGRVLTANNDLPGAARVLQGVIDGSEVESTRLQARYYLAEVMQKRQDHVAALEVSAPLAAQWDQGAGAPEFAGVFVLRGASSLALARAAAKNPQEGESSKIRLARCREVVEGVERYLKFAERGPLGGQARSLKAVAQALAGQKSESQQTLATMKKWDAERPETDQALLEVATIAFAAEDWDWARGLYGELAARPAATPQHPRALADLGWTEYKRKAFPEAAAAFGRLLTEHPDSELVAEAAFMRGRAWQDAGDLNRSQTAFTEAFARPGTSEHVFLAGLQSAGLLARLQKLPEADAVYEGLLKRFPGRADADKVIDQWATVHYAAEDFAKADELFRRLARDYPDSPLADNARLSLAESDLIAGRLDEARKGFRALATDAKADETVQQRALFQTMQIEVEAKRWDDLRRVCEESLQRFPSGTYRLEAQHKWAEAEFYSGAYPSARDRLTALVGMRSEPQVAQAPWLPQAWVMLAEAQFRLKDYKGVAATRGEVEKSSPDSPALYQIDEVLGRCFKAQALWTEARAAFERAVQSPQGKQTETAAKSQFHIAETYLFEKNYDEALKAYLKVEILYKYPEWQAPALFQAGVCQEALGQWKAAAKTYDELLRDYSDNKDVAPKARERLDQVRKKLAAG